MSAVNQSNHDILDRRTNNCSKASIFSDVRVRERFCAVLENAGVAEREFEEWIRRPPNWTTLRSNAHRTPTSALKEWLEDYLDKVMRYMQMPDE